MRLNGRRRYDSTTSAPYRDCACETLVDIYDEIEIEDFTWDADAKVYHYPCPCGDRFEITKSQLRDGDEVAKCPSCSLLIRVIYEWVSASRYPASEDIKPKGGHS